MLLEGRVGIERGTVVDAVVVSESTADEGLVVVGAAFEGINAEAGLDEVNGIAAAKESIAAEAVDGLDDAATEKGT